MAESSAASEANGFILPPPIESLLDIHKFDETVTCTAIRIPRQHTQSAIQRFNSRLFDREDTRNIPWLLKLDDQPMPESIVILKPNVAKDDLDEADLALINSTGATVETHDVFIGFDNRPVEWLLAQYMPHIENITSSFEHVGHIAHMNLRDEMLDAKYLIGAIVLLKHRDAGIKTVVNKVGAVENEFRVLPMELIAGEPTTMVEVPESGCVFKFDFKDVFWNSRLQGEHQRIVKLVGQKDLVCDMFAGIGPFAIPLARKGVCVHANDLNPKSYEWMLANAQSNLGRKKLANLTCYCLDGRAFIKQMVQEQKLQPAHILMNLPKLAPEFCDIFVGLFPKGHLLPQVHVYCFGTGLTVEIAQERAMARIQTALGGVTLTQPDLQVLKIRQTSTNTFEFAVSFTVPAEVGYMKD